MNEDVLTAIIVTKAHLIEEQARDIAKAICSGYPLLVGCPCCGYPRCGHDHSRDKSTI